MTNELNQTESFVESICNQALKLRNDGQKKITFNANVFSLTPKQVDKYFVEASRQLEKQGFQGYYNPLSQVLTLTWS